MKIGNNLMIGFENEWRQIRKMTGYRFRLITLEYQFYKFTQSELREKYEYYKNEFEKLLEKLEVKE